MYIMKKAVIVLLLILLLSGCHSQKFEYGSSVVDLESDLESILDKMMDKANYNDSQTVDYDKVTLAIDYRNGDVVVEGFQFSVFRKNDGDSDLFDMTGCFNVEGELKCREERGFIEGQRAGEEVLLVRAVDIYSKIDISNIVSELRRVYELSPTEGNVVIAHLVLPKDIEEDKEKYENRIFFYDDEYHYEEDYVTDDMMLELKVYFFGNGEGEKFVVYFELEK